MKNKTQNSVSASGGIVPEANLKSQPRAWKRMKVRHCLKCIQTTMLAGTLLATGAAAALGGVQYTTLRAFGFTNQFGFPTANGTDFMNLTSPAGNLFFRLHGP